MRPELLHGDWIDVMATLAANIFDTVCADPPHSLEFGADDLARYGTVALAISGGRWPTSLATDE